MLTTRSQRWRERRSTYVENLTTIDPRAYAVDVIAPARARKFVAAHHYLATYPAAQLAVGLFGPGGDTSGLAGVAVFAVPTTGAVVTRHTGLDNPGQGCVLARFVLTDDVAGNGETFFLARALRHLRREKPAIEAVVSYADPAAGHVGQVYAALSGAYRGQMPQRTAYRVRGIALSGRTLSKIRLDEPGAGGAIDQVVQLGIEPPRASETPPTWLARLSRERQVVRATHPGLHAYCFALTRRARRAGRDLAHKPYPKIIACPHPELPLGSTL